jgi:hypothetical protein
VRLREVEWLFWAAIVVAMCFDFTSGVHDASTAIASDVSTRALTTDQVNALFRPAKRAKGPFWCGLSPAQAMEGNRSEFRRRGDRGGSHPGVLAGRP